MTYIFASDLSAGDKIDDSFMILRIADGAGVVLLLEKLECRVA